MQFELPGSVFYYLTYVKVDIARTLINGLKVSLVTLLLNQALYPLLMMPEGPLSNSQTALLHWHCPHRALSPLFHQSLRNPNWRVYTEARTQTKSDFCRTSNWSKSFSRNYIEALLSARISNWQNTKLFIPVFWAFPFMLNGNIKTINIKFMGQLPAIWFSMYILWIQNGFDSNGCYCLRDTTSTKIMTLCNAQCRLLHKWDSFSTTHEIFYTATAGKVTLCSSINMKKISLWESSKIKMHELKQEFWKSQL